MITVSVQQPGRIAAIRIDKLTLVSYLKQGYLKIKNTWQVNMTVGIQIIHDENSKFINIIGSIFASKSADIISEAQIYKFLNALNL